MSRAYSLESYRLGSHVPNELKIVSIKCPLNTLNVSDSWDSVSFSSSEVNAHLKVTDNVDELKSI